MVPKDTEMILIILVFSWKLYLQQTSSVLHVSACSMHLKFYQEVALAFIGFLIQRIGYWICISFVFLFSKSLNSSFVFVNFTFLTTINKFLLILFILLKLFWYLMFFVCFTFKKYLKELQRAIFASLLSKWQHWPGVGQAETREEAFFWISHIWSIHLRHLLLAAFPDHSQGAWLKVECYAWANTHMGCHCYRGCLYPLGHSISPFLFHYVSLGH